MSNSTLFARTAVRATVLYDQAIAPHLETILVVAACIVALFLLVLLLRYISTILWTLFAVSLAVLVAYGIQHNLHMVAWSFVAPKVADLLQETVKKKA